MHIEFLLEEFSAAVTLDILVPKILGPDVSFKTYPGRGKDALLRQLPERLRAYSGWATATNTKIVVVVDRDRDDCKVLKGRLEMVARSAGLHTKSSPDILGDYDLVTRVACEELEAWFLGDPAALRAAYPRLSRRVGQRTLCQTPDTVAGGTWEALQRLLQRAGYYPAGLPKVEVARKVAAAMDIDQNNSQSFCHFRDALRDVWASQLPEAFPV